MSFVIVNQEFEFLNPDLLASFLLNGLPLSVMAHEEGKGSEEVILVGVRKWVHHPVTMTGTLETNVKRGNQTYPATVIVKSNPKEDSFFAGTIEYQRDNKFE